MVILIDIPAGGLADNIGGLQAVLQQVYDTMIVHCADLIRLSQGIAALASLFYLCFRLWPVLARNEAVDVLPLLRPFAISLVIAMFPALIALINGVMQPTVTGTSALVNDSNLAITTLLQQKQDALQHSNDWQMYVNTDGSGSLDKWEALSGEADSGVFSGLSNRIKFEMAKTAYNMKNSVKVWLSEVLQLLYESAALCINTIRIFFLIILAIFGPLSFAFSIFPGWGSILSSWLTKYINVFLWLPVANILGSLIGQIQQEMIKLDIAQLNSSGQTSFGPTDAAYIIFLLLSVVSYFTVPTVTNYIVHAGSGNLSQLSGWTKAKLTAILNS